MSDAAMDALAQEWHTTQNGPLQFGELSYGSGKKVWWRGRCGHEWQAEYRSRTTKGAGCPLCSGHLIISGINDLATVHPEIASEWYPIKNEEARPDLCARTSSKAVWWLGKCGHEWKSSISGRTSLGSGCPLLCQQDAGFRRRLPFHPGLDPGHRVGGARGAEPGRAP